MSLHYLSSVLARNTCVDRTNGMGSHSASWTLRMGRRGRHVQHQIRRIVNDTLVSLGGGFHRVLRVRSTALDCAGEAVAGPATAGLLVHLVDAATHGGRSTTIYCSLGSWDSASPDVLWPRVRCQECADLPHPAQASRRSTSSLDHHGRTAIAKAQLQAPRRTAGGAAVLDALRGSASHRALAAALQYDPTPFLAWLSTVGSGNDLAASNRPRLRSAPANPDAGQKQPDSNLIPGIAMWSRPPPQSEGLTESHSLTPAADREVQKPVNCGAHVKGYVWPGSFPQKLTTTKSL